jgi:hypothetical protein
LLPKGRDPPPQSFNQRCTEGTLGGVASAQPYGRCLQLQISGVLCDKIEKAVDKTVGEVPGRVYRDLIEELSSYTEGRTCCRSSCRLGALSSFFVLAILGPLLMFTPRMAAAKRKGLAYYGQVAQSYVDRFEEKWVLDTLPSEDVLGSGDIQSLADLNNSYDIVRSMRAIPFGLDDISRLALATAAPLAPLLLTVFSLDELITRLVKVVF